MVRFAFFLALIITAITVASSFGAVTSSDSVDQVRSNVRQQLLGSALATAPFTLALPGTSERDLQSMRPDGSWPDQVYTDTNNAHWLALQHLPRLERITRAYCRVGDHQAKIRERILASLRFWLNADPHNTNWWFNEIDVPREVGMIMIMLGDEVPPDLRQQGLAVMRRANWKRQAGANLLDETWIQVMRGCIENNSDTISQAFSRTWEELRIVDPKQEGIQADGSFHQHGPLLYNQGYGTVLLQCTLQFFAASQQTPYCPPDAVKDCIYTLALDGDAWMTWDNVWDFGVCGRSICRMGATDSRALWTMLQRLAEYPAGRSPELAAAILADSHHQPKAGNRHFWCSDYMVQRRPDYFASIRMYSTRTANTDALTNTENRKSHHIADGATCLMISGQEYFNIYPVWDWLRIPGTTVEQDAELPDKSIKRMGKSAFVGGVSDGTNGCAAMELIYNSLHAQKAWFCFDHEIICLGAGITCGGDHQVVTTLNQCLLNGPVYASNDSTPLPPGDYNRQGVRWLWHDNIGYVLPQSDAADNIQIKIGRQQGAWSDIGVGSQKVETRDVFTAVIDHGTRPADQTYAYILFPGITASSMASAAAQNSLQIISNTSRLQAVWDTRSQQLQAVFHEPGEIRVDGMQVRVDQPCLLLFTRTVGGATVAIANPMNQGMAVNMWTNLPVRQNSGVAIHIELPGGLHAGETVIRQLTQSPR